MLLKKHYNGLINQSINLNTIQTWANKWQVTFNPIKSEALLVSLRPNRDNRHDFTFQNHLIDNVNEHKHLGLIWNCDISWKSHLSSIIAKASKRIDMLSVLKFKLDRSTLEKVYFAFTRSIFEYAWDSTPRHDYLFNNMEKLQISAVRIVTGTNTYSSKQLLYHGTGWELLSSRREKQRLYHLPIYLNSILHIFLIIPGMNFATLTSKMPLQGLKHIVVHSCLVPYALGIL